MGTCSDLEDMKIVQCTTVDNMYSATGKHVQLLETCTVFILSVFRILTIPRKCKLLSFFGKSLILLLKTKFNFKAEVSILPRDRHFLRVSGRLYSFIICG